MNKYLILGTQWRIAIVIWRRQLTHILHHINVLHFCLATATYELNQCIVYEAVLILALLNKNKLI